MYAWRHWDWGDRGGVGGSLLQTQFSPEPSGLHNSSQTQKSKLCFIEERRTVCYGLWGFPLVVHSALRGVFCLTCNCCCRHPPLRSECCHTEVMWPGKCRFPVLMASAQWGRGPEIPHAFLQRCSLKISNLFMFASPLRAISSMMS